MSNKVYDRLKDFCLYGIPAIATCCITITKIWNIPYGEAISGTITAIGTCLGVFVKIACNEYKKKNEEFIMLNGGDKK